MTLIMPERIVKLIEEFELHIVSEVDPFRNDMIHNLYKCVCLASSLERYMFLGHHIIEFHENLMTNTIGMKLVD